jgi:hypothetical protein
VSKIILIICFLTPILLGIELVEYRILFGVWLIILAIFFMCKTVSFHSTILFKFKLINYGVIITGGFFFYNFITINGYDLANFIFASSVLFCCVSMFRITRVQ